MDVLPAGTCEWLVVLGMLLCAFSGVPGLFLGRSTLLGQRLAALIAGLGCMLGLVGVATYWVLHDSQEIAFPWPIPGGQFRVGIDGLSALFLVPIFLIALLGSIYGLSYWKQSDHAANGRRLSLFYGLLPAGMVLLTIARNSLLFLVGWEVMALSAFFLVTTEDEKSEVREAGWTYFVATHFSTLCLFALFALLRILTGSFDLESLAETQLSPALLTAVMVLSLLGFGLKAGIMPLHVWLPSSHAIAPSHVSALMSGVLIKMGIYGLLRITSLLPSLPLEWGATLLVLGVISAVLGVAYAIGQHDLKRLLAYHSIENIGIIVIGIGLAVLGRRLGRADWVVLGMCGALLHVWNHAIFKALLFLSAGSVIHATHTREIDQLGGLARLMPRTSLCFLVGAVAICGLPPLNGFVSEFLVYLGLFRTVIGGDEATALPGAAFAAPALALTGGLALACFVKVFGAVFLGVPRSDHTAQAHESPATMTGSMFVLVLCCVFIGLAPMGAVPALTDAVNAWAPGRLGSETPLVSLAPLGWISVLGVSLLGGIGVVALLLSVCLRRGSTETGPTWGCGYVAPTGRMQYTASSFAESLVRLFARALRPKRVRPRHLPLFPTKASFHSEVPDVVLDEAILPTFRLGARLAGRLRVLQQGNVQTYLLYIFLTLVALLLWS